MAKPKPIEDDERFKALYREYKNRCDQTRCFNSFCIASAVSIITSPLYVVGMSMQMSIIPNLTIYGDVKPKDINKGLLTDKIGLSQVINRKAIATSEKQLTKFSEPSSIATRPEARADLVKAAGQVGLNKPFRAPVYRTYYECIKGLYKQGALGFYKGNGLRLGHFVLFSTVSTQIQHDYLSSPDDIHKGVSYSGALAAGLFVSCALHILHLGEARFVLQNRLPNFQTYPSFMSMLRDSFNAKGREFMNGMGGHIPIMILLTMNHFNYFSVASIKMLAVQTAVLHTLAYPFLTAQRRLECQSVGKAGMLHPRYNNYLYCLYHIRKEEGLRGYYKGFPPYMIATAIVCGLIPFFSEALLSNSRLYGRQHIGGDNEDLYDEV